MHQNRQSLIRYATAALLGTAVLLSTTLPSFAAWNQRQGRDVLVKAKDAIPDLDGFRRTGTVVNNLKDGDTLPIPVTLKLNRTNYFLVICDANCDDIDLTLRNSKGGVVANGIPVGNFIQMPLVTAPGSKLRRTPQTGRLIQLSGQASLPVDANLVIEVKMNQCASSEPCSFALGWYTR